MWQSRALSAHRNQETRQIAFGQGFLTYAKVWYLKKKKSRYRTKVGRCESSLSAPRQSLNYARYTKLHGARPFNLSHLSRFFALVRPRREHTLAEYQCQLIWTAQKSKYEVDVPFFSLFLPLHLLNAKFVLRYGFCWLMFLEIIVTSCEWVNFGRSVKSKRVRWLLGWRFTVSVINWQPWEWRQTVILMLIMRILLCWLLIRRWLDFRCPNGYIGQRCEFKDLDGSYLREYI